MSNSRDRSSILNGATCVVLTQTGDFSLASYAHCCGASQQQADELRLPFGAGFLKDVFEMGFGSVDRHMKPLRRLFEILPLKQERGNIGLRTAQAVDAMQETSIRLLLHLRIAHEYGGS